MHDLNTIIEMNKPGGIQPKTITADSRPKPRIVIVIEGGLVQEVLSTEPVNYAVVDYDIEGTEEDNLVAMPQGEGKTEECYGYTSNSNVTPERAVEMFTAING